MKRRRAGLGAAVLCAGLHGWLPPVVAAGIGGLWRIATEGCAVDTRGRETCFRTDPVDIAVEQLGDGITGVRVISPDGVSEGCTVQCSPATPACAPVAEVRGGVSGDSVWFTLVGTQAVTVDCGVCRFWEESSDTFEARGVVAGNRIAGTFTEEVADRCAGDGPDCSAFSLDCLDARARGTFEVEILPLTPPTPTGTLDAVPLPSPTATGAGRTEVRYRLAAALGPADAALLLERAEGLPARGALRIEAEVVAYEAIVGSMRVGLTRGVRGTHPAAHGAGTAVRPVGGGGDANCDAAATAADVVAVLQGWGSEGEAICGGDVDGNAGVGAEDARAAVRLSFGGRAAAP